MTQQANFVQEGVDRLREAVSAIETDIERMQNRVQKEFKARRKDIEKRTQKQVKRLRTELRKNAYVKRAQGVVDDATKQFEQGVDSVLEVLNVASKRDLTRIERKLNQINRKLRDLEKAKQGNGEAKTL
jgi:hypothetical protein